MFFLPNMHPDWLRGKNFRCLKSLDTKKKEFVHVRLEMLCTFKVLIKESILFPFSEGASVPLVFLCVTDGTSLCTLYSYSWKKASTLCCAPTWMWKPVQFKEA